MPVAGPVNRITASATTPFKASVDRITASMTTPPAVSGLESSRLMATAATPPTARPAPHASIRPDTGIGLGIAPRAVVPPVVRGGLAQLGGAGAGSSGGVTVGSTTKTGDSKATGSNTGPEWTYQTYEWSETIVTGTDGYGGNYTWDDRKDLLIVTSLHSGVGRTDHVASETYTLHDSGGDVTEDETYKSTGNSTDINPPDGRHSYTDHETTSDTFDFEDKATGVVAAAGVSGSDSFDDTQQASQTTDLQYAQNYDGQGGVTSQTTEKDQGSESFGTSDNGTATLSGAATGSDTFNAGSSDSDNWTHNVNANDSFDDSGNYSKFSTTTDTDSGTDASNDGVNGGDSFTSGSSGGTDNFNDGESSSDQYNVSVTTTTALSGGISSGSTSDTLTASGQGKANDEDRGTDSNGDGSSDNFDGTYGDKEVWTTEETKFNSSDGLGGTTSGGSAKDTNSAAVTLEEAGGDSGPISDSSGSNSTESGSNSVQGSWSIAVNPDGATTATGSVTYDDSVSDVANNSTTGGASGESFKQADSTFVESDVSGTNNADGSDKYKVKADGADSSSFDLNGPDAGGTATLDESGSAQWTSNVSGANAVDGSGSSSFTASDSGGDSIMDSGSGTATTPTTEGTDTSNVVLKDTSSDNYSDGITGNTAIDTYGSVTGGESYSSSDRGQDQMTLTDSGSDSVSYDSGGPDASLSVASLTRINPTGGGSASDLYSLQGTDGDNYTYTNTGSVTVDPTGTSGDNTLTCHIEASDSFGGTASAAVTPSGGPTDNLSLTLSGSDSETLDETIATIETNGTTTSSTTSGTDSGTDRFNLSDSDATNSYTEDDSDIYNDPVGGSVNTPTTSAPGVSASGIQPAGAGAGDRSSSTRSGTPPGGWDSPALAVVGGFFGNLWDRATYVPKTVWANTEGDGFASRVYTTAGTTVGSLVGVTQVSDAFSQHDAVDGHEQTTGERVFKGITGSIQLATVGVGAAAKVTSAVIPTKVAVPNPQALLNNAASGARGTQLADSALLDKLRARGYTIDQSDEIQAYLSLRGANAATFRTKDLLLKPDPRKIEVLEEFLHNVQEKIGLPGEMSISQLEVHVKNFMLRHRKLLGISEPGDIQWLTDWLAQAGGL